MTSETDANAQLPQTGERYIPGEGGAIKLEHMHRYAACRELVRGRVVLDIACGEGYGTALMAKWASNAYGVDIAPAAVAHARREYGANAANLTYLQGDCANIPLPDGSVDIVVSFETIEHHDRHEEMIGEAKRVLRSDGLLIISSPNKLAYSDIPNYCNPYHVKELYLEELKSLLACFRNVRLYGQKVGLGSFLVPLDLPTYSLQAVACDGQALGVGASLSGLPLYFLAVCSDMELPPSSPMGSVLTDRQEDAYQQLIDGYRGQEAMATQRTHEAAELREHLEALRAKLRLDAERAKRLSQTLAIANATCDRLHSSLQVKELGLQAKQQLVEYERARARDLASELEAVRGSRSWRVTEPMRAAVIKARSIRASARRLARNAYYHLPVTDETRRRLKSGFYSAFGFVLDGSKSYEHWKRFGDLSSAQVGQSDASPLETTPASAASGPRALVVDDRTPARDRDAGSLRIIHVIRILQSLGYEVTFAPVDLKRVSRDAEYLESLGTRCLTDHDTPSIEAHLAAEGSSYSLIYSSRPDPTAALLPLYRRYAPMARVVYDTQDLHFLRERRFAELAGDQSLLDAAAWRKQQELELVHAVDFTLVVSDAERQILERESPGARVHVLSLLHDPFPNPAGFSERRDLVFLGGYQHQPNVDAVQFFVREILPLVRQHLPGVRLYVAGSNPPPELLSLASDEIVITGQLPDLSDVMNQCRVAVNPLRYGAGVKGKVLTAMSYGLPSVGTGLAAEGMNLRDGEDILLADEPNAFAEAVARLYTDEALWNRMSRNSRTVLQERYSMACGIRSICELHELVGLRLPPGAGHASTMPQTNVEAPPLPISTIHDGAEYRSLQAQNAVARQSNADYERSLALPFRSGFVVAGQCFTCGQPQGFHVDHEYGFTLSDGTRIPNWRERLVCPSCNLNCRMRASVHLWTTIFQPSTGQRVYVTEQRTPLFVWLRTHFRDISGSEYIGTSLPFGSTTSDGTRNESLTHLTFPDSGFDHILSFDVLEHIPDYGKALCEVYRCLAPGGTFFFSVPFDLSSDTNIVRARVAVNGNIEHILPPEYHGDPLNTEGCLCFYHFGWSLLDELRQCGFSEVAAHLTWSREYAYLGGDQLFFSAQKPI